ncbi:hypothetical protein [Bradyrhizobium sp. DASA03120]|uniref:hypothetical protein n=1 Tax=Bradyrhizobium sp. SMVTL-02 TaxID=3395917 RepID=UPI003F70ED64
MTKLADDPATEAAKKAVAEEKKATEKAQAEYAYRTRGKPTPTQAENDIVAQGGHILEHEDDGSGPQEREQLPENRKHLEAERSQHKPQTYQTRQARSE